MKKLYVCLCLCLISSILFAQTRDRVISGQLKSTDDGSPLPGVNVVIKGTTDGTVTDSDGRYSLSVPIGSVLVFSFVGMQTREVLVTETGLQPVRGDFAIHVKSRKQTWNPSILQDTVELPGVATLNDKTPSYKIRNNQLNPSDIVSIRELLLNARIFKGNKNKFVINTNSDQYRPKGIRIQYSHAINFEVAGKLPVLQSSYAQGRNVNGMPTWQGPDQSETMSWGPQVKTLEYTGSNYPYDRNGTITTAGNGDGKPVNAHNPFDFFRTALTNSDEIILWIPGIKQSTLSVDFARKSHQGVIPNNRLESNNFSLSMKRMNLSQRLKADLSLLLNSSNGRLLNRGSNISNLIGSLMITSPTFDLTNGYGSSGAVGNSLSYLLPDGSIRSTAPGLIDNPYGLVNQLPDREKNQRLNSSFGLTYEQQKLQVSLNGSVDNQTNDITNGTFPGYSGFLQGRRMERHEERNDAALNLLSSYKFSNNYYNSWTLSFGYHFRQENRSISRTDGFGYMPANFNSVVAADSIHRFDFSKTRDIHEVATRLQFESGPYNMQLGNRSYFSNTINSSFVNLFPSLTFKVDLHNLVYIDFLNELKPYVSIGRSIRESPLLFGNNSSLSTQLAPTQYNRYFENQELTWHSQLKPETELKFETGLRAHTNFNLQFDFSYYNNTTFGMIMPVWNTNQFILQNVATVNNRGTNVSASFNPWSYYQDKINWGISLRWTKYNSVVKGLDVPNSTVPLAGFNSIQTVAAKDQPLGAIYGTTFLHDDHGRTIIGADGFPLVNSQLSYLGSPIPKFMISLEPYITLNKRWKFDFIIDFKKGGQVWNGTKAALNYAGRSQQTGEQRNISNYVFDGVTTNGAVNTVP
ncbi:MAG TPA: carboxypeptidase-like regulatory domain-containing protein, partial [Cyclobacteriaceae bacterium]|nr:carboxypeptidase-like regulatory domain-containing protein [Cyclobacteriaceae bacterium]